jgi:hypothetical protein
MRKLKQTTICLAFLITLTGQTNGVQTEPAWVHDAYHRGDFKLAERNRVADIVVAAEDFKVVQIAAENFAADVQRVTGTTSNVHSNLDNLRGHVVFAGTLGKSSFIDSLVSQRKLDVGRLRGQWESFLITTVADPVPGVSLGLVIAGSDRRGTAFGIFELSEAIGVSPWYWWADVTPQHRESLFVASSTRRAGTAVGPIPRHLHQRRRPWSSNRGPAKTFDPELGDIGPKTYARVFELLVTLESQHSLARDARLHQSLQLVCGQQTRCRRLLQSSWALLMPSRCCGTTLPSGWRNTEDYDYTRNADAVRRYWEQRVEQNGKFESIYTIGMRGIHDSPIQGPTTQPERIKVLEQIFTDQRGLLAKHVRKGRQHVPADFLSLQRSTVRTIATV